MPVPTFDHPEHGPLALGKLPPKFDARNLRLARYIEPGFLTPPPPQVTHSELVKAPWQMFANDRVGDCAVASIATAEMIWTAWSGEPDAPTDDQVLAMYSKIGGYDPSKTEPGGYNPTDNGLYLLDVLNYWRKHGLDRRRAWAFAQVNQRDPLEVRFAISEFGGVYTGVSLPLTAQGQIGGLWESTSEPGSQPGSWGGHAIWVPDYFDNGDFGAVTWARKQRMSWPFVLRYADEMFVVIPTFWHTNPPEVPGFDWQRLNFDLSQVAA